VGSYPGATAAEILRTEDTAATITIVADDPFPVYYRPALKDYLGGKVREDKLWARPTSYYSTRAIHLLHDQVVGLDVRQHVVWLRSGKQLPYTRLLLAHGARAKGLTCPGANLVGVTPLRTIADYQRVLSYVQHVRRVVVVGSGTLALETIETLRHRGFAVTHLLRRRTLWSEVLDPVASDLVLQQEMRDGVDVRFEQEVAEIRGHNGQVVGVHTTTGAWIPCELVLLGIGIEPLTDFVSQAGIVCGQGVKVDGAMRTNAPDVYAAGDLIETSDPITGKTRVIGQWYPAIQQARAAAYSMLDLLDTEHPFNFGNFYNATFLYGLDFASVGLSTLPKERQGYQEIQADPQPRDYQKVVLKEGIPVGMFALGNRAQVLTFKRAIDHQVNLSSVASRLFAPDFNLRAWLDQQGVPPPIMGVSREGANVVKHLAYQTARMRSAINSLPKMDEGMLVPLAPPDVVATVPETYLSQKRVTLIGRHEGARLPVNHRSVSRRHAEISYANGHYVLRDLGSSNGTFLNQQPVQPGSVHLLTSGDVLSLGQVTFAFRHQQADPGASVLLRIQKPPTGESMSATMQRSSIPLIESGEATLLVKADVLFSAPSLPDEQPIFASDGSLRIPGVAQPLSPKAATVFKTHAGLVSVVRGRLEIHPLEPGKEYLLGRGADCHVKLLDMSVSRKHAKVFATPDGYSIQDLGGSNGVRVNQTRLDNPYRLTHGDRISISSITLYFIDVQPSAASETHSVVTCQGCGATHTIGARFCPRCGASVERG
jgi:NADPH-dependent 2,4-dienoyl-CoA reductase/sulfur reductase-like enzyme/pSer/pThr/pTyr-binding forkhead associated (FHA) protein